MLFHNGFSHWVPPHPLVQHLRSSAQFESDEQKKAHSPMSVGAGQKPGLKSYLKKLINLLNTVVLFFFCSYK